MNNYSKNYINKKATSSVILSRLPVFVIIVSLLLFLSIYFLGTDNSQSNVVSLKSDLEVNSQILKKYFDKQGTYPLSINASNCPDTLTEGSEFCLKNSIGATLNYQADANGMDYALYASKNSAVYKVTSTAKPFATGLSEACPTGFIVVPGSSTYGITSSFCAMKYEAKCALIEAPKVGLISPNTDYDSYDNNKIACNAENGRAVVSAPTGYALTNISQLNAITYSAGAYGCRECQIMSDAQWLTIAQNVLSNPANWSGGSVGIGYIYSGHNDTLPARGLASGADSNGYFGTENTSGNQKRTLTLTNGEIIWDLSGNVREWTGAQQAGGQPIGTPLAWREWTAVSGGRISPSPYPAITGLSGAYSWNSSNGIGMILNDSEDNKAKGFIRGGDWAGGINDGVLSLALGTTPTFRGVALGFRVAR